MGRLCDAGRASESYAKHRIGVALACVAEVGTARSNAKLAVSKVKPRKV